MFLVQMDRPKVLELTATCPKKGMPGLKAKGGSPRKCILSFWLMSRVSAKAYCVLL